MDPMFRIGPETNTFTILARCPQRGALGTAIATYSLAVGGTCQAIKSGVGVMASQAFGDPRLRPLAMGMLEAGLDAYDTLERVKRKDPYIEYRQIGIVDSMGRVAAHTGPKARPWHGHMVGRGYVVMGNALVGGQVLEAMSKAYEASELEELEERLLRALEAGRDAGGQPQGQRSSVLVAHREESYPWMDLRVDAHSEPVGELRRVYETYKPMATYYYEMRPKDPAHLPTQDEWLARQKWSG